MLSNDFLVEFEQGLNPREPAESAIPATIVGYGEMSAIFALDADKDHVYKRLPLFKDMSTAEQYRRMYYEYCGLLEKAGLNLPGHDSRLVAVPGRPISLYIAQKTFPENRFAHKAIHELDDAACLELVDMAVDETNKAWAFNAANGPETVLAIDGQLSNWVLGGEEPRKLYYIDTSTPLFCLKGVEQQNPELLLQSAPGFLRWVIRLFFLEDVMTRYYVPRLVFMDLVANLYKEQRPELIGRAIDLVNGKMPQGQDPLSKTEVDKYYREDKMIWRVFLGLRRFDRFLATRLLRRRYEFILPGKIKR